MADHDDLLERELDLEPGEKLDVRLYFAHLRKLSDEELLQAERDVLELLEHPGWLRVQEIVAATLEGSTARMRYADPKDPATMWRDIGMQAGMDSVRVITKAVLFVAQRRQKKIAEKVEREQRKAASREA